MGFGVGGVIGAKLAAPGSPAVTVCGDGCFLMHANAVATAVEYDIPAVWVVWNNTGYGSIRGQQATFFGADREIATRFRQSATGELYSTDISAIARAMGADGARIDSPDEVADAVEAAIKSDRPTVLDVRVDSDRGRALHRQLGSAAAGRPGARLRLVMTMAGSQTARLLPFIGGRHVEVAEFTDLVEPYAGRVVARVGRADAGTVAAAVSAAASARPEMAAMPVHERARLLRAAADLVPARAARPGAGDYRRNRQGHLPHQAGGEPGAMDTARVRVRGRSAAAASPPPDLIPGGEGVTVVLARRPVGTVAAITPFNAPLNLVAHKVGPPSRPGTACGQARTAGAGAGLRLAEILTEAGFPAGAVNVVPGGRDTGAALLADPRVDLVSFTGERRPAGPSGPRRASARCSWNWAATRPTCSAPTPISSWPCGSA